MFSCGRASPRSTRRGCRRRGLRARPGRPGCGAGPSRPAWRAAAVGLAARLTRRTAAPGNRPFTRPAGTHGPSVPRRTRCSGSTFPLATATLQLLPVDRTLFLSPSILKNQSSACRESTAPTNELAFHLMYRSPKNARRLKAGGWRLTLGLRLGNALAPVPARKRSDRKRTPTSPPPPAVVASSLSLKPPAFPGPNGQLFPEISSRCGGCRREKPDGSGNPEYPSSADSFSPELAHLGQEPLGGPPTPGRRPASARRSGPAAAAPADPRPPGRCGTRPDAD